MALPLFGYKLSLVTEALGSNSPVDDNSLRTDPTAEAFTSYGAPPAYEGYARSLASSLVSRFSKTSTWHGSPNYPELTGTHTQHSTTQQAYCQHLRVTPYFSVRKHSARGVQFFCARGRQPRARLSHLVHSCSHVWTHCLRHEAFLNLGLLQLLPLHEQCGRRLRLLGPRLPVREPILCTGSQPQP